MLGSLIAAHALLLLFWRFGLNRRHYKSKRTVVPRHESSPPPSPPPPQRVSIDSMAEPSELYDAASEGTRGSVSTGTRARRRASRRSFLAKNQIRLSRKLSIPGSKVSACGAGLIPRLPTPSEPPARSTSVTS